MKEGTQDNVLIWIEGSVYFDEWPSDTQSVLMSNQSTREKSKRENVSSERGNLDRRLNHLVCIS